MFDGNNKIFTIVTYILLLLGILGVVGCLAAYFVTKIDFLFIPLSLCGVLAMTSFAFTRVKR